MAEYLPDLAVATEQNVLLAGGSSLCVGPVGIGAAMGVDEG